MAITRFLGREFGLAGKDNWTQAKVDEVIDSVSDLINSKYREVLWHTYLIKLWFVVEMMPIFHAKDEEQKKIDMAKFNSETLPPAMANFDKVIDKHGGDFFMGDEVGLYGKHHEHKNES